MARVRAVATMYTDLEWVGDIPDDIPEDERYAWVKYNVDGAEYSEIGSGDWKLEWVEAEDE